MRLTWNALLLGAVCLSAAAARATPSRVVAMGDLGRYLDDDTNVLTYPGELPKFTHFAFIDLGGTSGLQSALSATQASSLNGGAFLRLGEGLSLGLVASDFAPKEVMDFYESVSGYGRPNKGTFDFLKGLAALRRYDLIGAYGDKTLGFGARLSIGSQSEEFVQISPVKITGTKEDRSSDYYAQRQMRLALGASGLATDGTSWDGAFDIGNYGLTYLKNDKEPFTSPGGFGIGINGRVRLPLLRSWDIIPQIGYRLSSFSLSETKLAPVFGEGKNDPVDGLPANENNTYTRVTQTLDVGVGASLRASKTSNFVLATGFLLNYSDANWDGKRTPDGAPKEVYAQEKTVISYSLPYLKFGFEAVLVDWLKVRGGVEKFAWYGSTYDYKKEPIGGKSTVTETSSANNIPVDGAAPLADFESYVGASAFYNGFTLDLVLDKGFLMRGPAFISGAAGAIAGRASLGYKF